MLKVRTHLSCPSTIQPLAGKEENCHFGVLSFSNFPFFPTITLGLWSLAAFKEGVPLIRDCLMEIQLYWNIIFHHIFQKNSCFINNYCFATNEANPINWCQQCIPNMSERTWTKRQGICNEMSVHVSFNLLSRRKPFNQLFNLHMFQFSCFRSVR